MLALHGASALRRELGGLYSSIAMFLGQALRAFHASPQALRMVCCKRCRLVELTHMPGCHSRHSYVAFEPFGSKSRRWKAFQTIAQGLGLPSPIFGAGSKVKSVVASYGYCTDSVTNLDHNDRDLDRAVALPLTEMRRAGHKLVVSRECQWLAPSI